MILLERGYNRLRDQIAPTAQEVAALNEEMRRFQVNGTNAADDVGDAMSEAADRVAALAETPADVEITTNAQQAQAEINMASEALRFMPHNVPVKITGNFLDAYKQAASVRAMLGSIAGTYHANISVGYEGPAGINPNAPYIPGHFAAGGPVSAGAPIVVGEEGPELFMPNSAGNIVPNDVAFGGSLGGGAQQTISIVIPVMLDGREVGRGAIHGTLDQLQTLGVIQGGMVACRHSQRGRLKY